MNLKIKIDKYGNLINLDTGTIILASNELFTDSFWETDGTTWKVNTTTQVTASASDAMPTVVPIGEFTQHSRVDFYFRLHLPILDYNKAVNIFEFGISTSNSSDIRFYKPANFNNYCLYANSTKQDLPIASTESLDIVGVLTMYNIGSNTLAVFITLYSNENGILTKLVENAYRGSSSNKLYFGVSRDYHTNLSSYMVEGIAFDEDIIINPSNNNINPISAVTKYLNGTGLAEVWSNTKNYISAQLLGKSDVGHTHSASDITSGLSTVATSGSYNDLSNKPIIPSKTSDLTNDSDFISSAIKEGDYGNQRYGWCLLYGDLLIQWGTESRFDRDFRINFTKPFSATPLIVANYGDAVNHSTPCTVYNEHTTYFNIAHSNDGAWRGNWIAIGKGD